MTRRSFDWSKPMTSFLALHFLRIYTVCFLSSDVVGDNVWSLWFPTLTLSGSANQTLERIKQDFGYTCDQGDLLDTQCRAKNWTSQTEITAAVYVDVPCNHTGRGCDHSTIEDPDCGLDIRFLCHVEDTTNPQTVDDHSLKVNGGFIAMAAGLSVIVPLICVLIIQLRRSKREERERARAARAAADAEAGEQPADDPPPTYEQLFGSTAHPASGEAAHSREGSLDVLIETDEPGPDRRGRDAARDRGLHLQLPVPPSGGQTAHGNVGPPEVPPDGVYVNQGFSSTSVSTISGSQVFDYPLSAPFSSLGSARSLSRSMDTVITIDVVDAVDPSPGHSTTPPGSSPNLSSSSAESTRDAPPPPLTPTAPPPPYQSPAAGRHQVQVSGVSSTSSGSSAIQQVLRRFPGMHISIQDIFSSFRGQQENENEGPPPSYEEALKILESAKLSTQHILGKIN